MLFWGTEPRPSSSQSPLCLLEREGSLRLIKVGAGRTWRVMVCALRTKTDRLRLLYDFDIYGRHSAVSCKTRADVAQTGGLFGPETSPKKMLNSDWASYYSHWINCSFQCSFKTKCTDALVLNLLTLFRTMIVGNYPVQCMNPSPRNSCLLSPQGWGQGNRKCMICTNMWGNYVKTTILLRPQTRTHVMNKV